MTGGKVPQGVAEFVWARDRDLCRYCGALGEVLDHVVARAAGGPATRDNLVVACRSCNAVAGSLLFANFDDKFAYLKAERGRRRPRSRWPASRGRLSIVAPGKG